VVIMLKGFKGILAIIFFVTALSNRISNVLLSFTVSEIFMVEN
jgi:hypothetical protein